jgi:hypothetical protein
MKSTLLMIVKQVVDITSRLYYHLNATNMISFKYQESRNEAALRSSNLNSNRDSIIELCCLEEEEDFSHHYHYFIMDFLLEAYYYAFLWQ